VLHTPRSATSDFYYLNYFVLLQALVLKYSIEFYFGIKLTFIGADYSLVQVEDNHCHKSRPQYTWSGN